MNKQQFREEQPIAYRTLSHALKNDKLAHAYLFHGPAGTPKVTCAELLAQSILCTNRDQDGFGCEQCIDCRRIKEHQMTDFIYLDGTSTSIKKENILKLQQEFSKTGLEHTGKKIYMINHAENATVDALNSLLKFLEEPNGQMIAILICDQCERLLPTIISRCQMIPFHPLSRKACFDLCKNDIGELDAYLLSAMIHSPQEMRIASESEEYGLARHLFLTFIKESTSSIYQAHATLLKEGFDHKKIDGKLCMKYFLEMLMTFYRDMIKGKTEISDESYQSCLIKQKAQMSHPSHVLEILITTRDKLWKSVNLTLLCDQMIYRIQLCQNKAVIS